MQINKLMISLAEAHVYLSVAWGGSVPIRPHLHYPYTHRIERNRLERSGPTETAGDAG